MTDEEAKELRERGEKAYSAVKGYTDPVSAVSAGWWETVLDLLADRDRLLRERNEARKEVCEKISSWTPGEFSPLDAASERYGSIEARKLFPVKG